MNRSPLLRLTLSAAALAALLSACASSPSIYKRTRAGEGWVENGATLAIGGEDSAGQRREKHRGVRARLGMEIEDLQLKITQKKEDIERLELELSLKARRLEAYD